MIDKLNLTIYKQPDLNFLESQGDIIEALRDKIYKNMCVLDKGVVLYRLINLVRQLISACLIPKLI